MLAVAPSGFWSGLEGLGTKKLKEPHMMAVKANVGAGGMVQLVLSFPWWS